MLWTSGMTDERLKGLGCDHFNTPTEISNWKDEFDQDCQAATNNPQLDLCRNYSFQGCDAWIGLSSSIDGSLSVL